MSILNNLTWESPTLLWTFKILMRAGETRKSLNDCYYIILVALDSDLIFLALNGF